jgi:signal peptidase I
VKEVKKIIQPKGFWQPYIFPFDSVYPWNVDNFGPLVIPKAGVTVQLNSKTILLYEKVIKNYELNNLEVDGNTILINGKPATSYTFKMDYYWMMGDNRHNSADSRFWGFVPVDHIVGKAVFVWLSLDNNKSLFGGKIRMDKLFRTIK